MCGNCIESICQGNCFREGADRGPLEERFFSQFKAKTFTAIASPIVEPNDEFVWAYKTSEPSFDCGPIYLFNNEKCCGIASKSKGDLYWSGFINVQSTQKLIGADFKSKEEAMAAIFANRYVK
ncbi:MULTISPECIES: hypothetical protein [Vibrio]|uniref:hypothetical protein n=1 Tax=Vibrio TaxID=662 RepID=UPI000841D811|nr:MULTISPECIES: hypothetical protein [Vibrio]ODM57033.1 hypothetical protein BC455_18245 [Vibrio harveyi]USD58624.1 hypothetical protein J4N44_27105 [Vibrio sp. SCSIO 43155]